MGEEFRLLACARLQRSWTRLVSDPGEEDRMLELHEGGRLLFSFVDAVHVEGVHTATGILRLARRK
jgi:hypothetical protein